MSEYRVTWLAKDGLHQRLFDRLTVGEDWAGKWRDSAPEDVTDILLTDADGKVIAGGRLSMPLEGTQ